MSGGKECFVISPIGSEESDVRERADKLMKHIIEEALGEFDYTPIRADDITEPGSITSQVIQKTVDSELVIADLTNHNPNVFYELAVRHATAKPYIQLIDSSESIPFDISDLRTIKYDFDVSNARRACEEIQEYVRSIEGGNSTADNPISRSAELKSWRESEDPVQQNLAEILEGVTRINKRIDTLEQEVQKQPKQEVGSSQKQKYIKSTDSTSEILNLFTELNESQRDAFVDVLSQRLVREGFDGSRAEAKEFIYDRLFENL